MQGAQPDCSVPDEPQTRDDRTPLRLATQYDERGDRRRGDDKELRQHSGVGGREQEIVHGCDCCFARPTARRASWSIV